MKNILNFKEFINESNKPDEEDCFISSNGFKLSVSCGGKHQGDFVEDDDALKCVNDWQKKNDWYPTIWWVSDHGNTWPIDSKGNEIKMTEDDDE